MSTQSDTTVISNSKVSEPKLKTHIKMQAASCFRQPFPLPKSVVKTKDLSAFTLSNPVKTTSSATRRISLVKAASSFNYDSEFSVFPAEACETIGGEACDATMFPEAKLSQTQRSSKINARVIEEIDREYFDYESEPSSVLMEEACDDLGGEFCATP